MLKEKYRVNNVLHKTQRPHNYFENRKWCFVSFCVA